MLSFMPQDSQRCVTKYNIHRKDSSTSHPIGWIPAICPRHRQTDLARLCHVERRSASLYGDYHTWLPQFLHVGRYDILRCPADSQLNEPIKAQIRPQDTPQSSSWKRFRSVNRSDFEGCYPQALLDQLLYPIDQAGTRRLGLIIRSYSRSNRCI